MASDASTLLMEEWKLREEDFVGSRDMRSDLGMVLVPLPDRVRGLDTRMGNSDAEAYQLQELLHHQYRVEVPVKCLNGRLYVRISAHVYNELDDYARFAAILNTLVH